MSHPSWPPTMCCGAGGGGCREGGVSLTIEVHAPVPVEVYVLQDLVHLLRLQLLPQQRRDGLPHLRAADLPVPVHVELRRPQVGGGHPPHRPHHPPSRAMVTPWSSGHHPLRACDDPHGHGSPVVMVSPQSVSPPCQWSPPWSPFPHGHSHPVVTVPSVPLGHPHGHCSPMGTVIPWSPRGHCPLRACGRPHGHRPHYGLSRVPVPSVPAVTLMAVVPPAPPWPRSPVAVAVPHGRRS